MVGRAAEIRRERTAGRRGSGGGGGGWDELVALDFGGDADVAVGVGLDAHDLPATANIDFAALRDLLRQGQHEFDLGADFKLRFSEKIESLIADVAGLRAKFAGCALRGEGPVAAGSW